MGEGRAAGNGIGSGDGVNGKLADSASPKEQVRTSSAPSGPMDVFSPDGSVAGDLENGNMRPGEVEPPAGAGCGLSAEYLSAVTAAHTPRGQSHLAEELDGDHWSIMGAKRSHKPKALDGEQSGPGGRVTSGRGGEPLQADLVALGLGLSLEAAELMRNGAVPKRKRVASVEEAQAQLNAFSKSPWPSGVWLAGELRTAKEDAEAVEALHERQRRDVREETMRKLAQFAPLTMVWLKSGTKGEPWWPALVVDPLVLQLPDGVMRRKTPNSVCAVCFGPSSLSFAKNEGRNSEHEPREFAWVGHRAIKLFRDPKDEALFDSLTDQEIKDEKVRARFVKAMEEAFLYEQGHSDILGMAFEFYGGEDEGSKKRRKGGNRCDACNLTLRASASNRGGKGSTNTNAAGAYTRTGRSRTNRLCRTCSSLWDNKQYCRVCEYIFFPNAEGNWLQCDQCDFWLHAECVGMDEAAFQAVLAEDNAQFFCTVCKPRAQAQPLNQIAAAPVSAPRVDVVMSSSSEDAEFATSSESEAEVSEAVVGPPEVNNDAEGKVYGPLTEAEAARESGSPPSSSKMIPTMTVETHEPGSISYLKTLAEGKKTQLPAGWRVMECLKPGKLDRTFFGPYGERYKKFQNVQKAIRETPEKYLLAEYPTGIFFGGNGFPPKKRVYKKKAAPASELTLTQASDARAAERTKRRAAKQKAKEKAKKARRKEREAKYGKRLHLPFEPIVQAGELDRCSICFQCEDWEGNVLASCRKCQLTVHPICYGIGLVQTKKDGHNDERWTCYLCRKKVPADFRLCTLCPFSGGALKPLADDLTQATLAPKMGKAASQLAGEIGMAHLLCASWVPETEIADAHAMEPIAKLDQVSRSRWSSVSSGLQCEICKQPHGACIQCSHPNCFASFHPMCGKMADYYMETKEIKGEELRALRVAQQRSEQAEQRKRESRKREQQRRLDSRKRKLGSAESSAPPARPPKQDDRPRLLTERQMAALAKREAEIAMAQTEREEAEQERMEKASLKLLGVHLCSELRTVETDAEGSARWAAWVRERNLALLSEERGGASIEAEPSAEGPSATKQTSSASDGHDSDMQEAASPGVQVKEEPGLKPGGVDVSPGASQGVVAVKQGDPAADPFVPANGNLSADGEVAKVKEEGEVGSGDGKEEEEEEEEEDVQWVLLGYCKKHNPDGPVKGKEKTSEAEAPGSHAPGSPTSDHVGKVMGGMLRSPSGRKRTLSYTREVQRSPVKLRGWDPGFARARPSIDMVGPNDDWGEPLRDGRPGRKALVACEVYTVGGIIRHAPGALKDVLEGRTALIGPGSKLGCHPFPPVYGQGLTVPNPATGRPNKMPMSIFHKVPAYESPEVKEAREASYAGLTGFDRQLEEARRERYSRLAIGKSRIHNWGLFTRRDFKAGDLVVEYIGQVINQVEADRREADYERRNIDNYMFALEQDVVIDGTMHGSIPRLYNHCCDPTCYTKPVKDSKGVGHVCFFAKRDISAGEELTFDYRFEKESEDRKIPCYCGASICKGTMN